MNLNSSSRFVSAQWLCGTRHRMVQGPMTGGKHPALLRATWARLKQTDKRRVLRPQFILQGDSMSSDSVPAFDRARMYGHRARIGYTSPPLTTEVFPYEFYKVVPEGVTLVITTLAIVVRSKDEIDTSY